jgi:prolyl 4-hydroxylase
MATQAAADVATVGARLAATPGVQKVPNSKLDLYVIKNFLDAAACEALIARIDSRRRPSTIADDTGVAKFRTSETCDLDAADPVVAAVDVKIGAVLGIDLRNGEPLQGQRYGVGQEFKPHTDTFNPGGYDYYLHTGTGGQRTWTAMLYLNAPEEGGGTRFKAIGKTIRPEPGKLLAWNNLLADGSPNPATLHQGMKVRSGVKYVITKWYRQQPLG